MILPRARFLREAEVSAHLKHEHILPLFDFGEVDGRLFLVTPYIEGGTLAVRLKKNGPMPQARLPLLSASKTGRQTADTTGPVNCYFFGACQQWVDVQDVIDLVNQMEPGLKQSLTHDLQRKMSAAHGTQIGLINFSDPVMNSHPQIGDSGQTVTVMLTEQGSVGYFLNNDETEVVNQSLAAAVGQLGQGYQIVASTLTIGQPATRSIDPSSGVSTIEFPAGAIARYQFSQAQLQAISNGLVGKSLAAAEAFLKSQPGIDPSGNA